MYTTIHATLLILTTYMQVLLWTNVCCFTRPVSTLCDLFMFGNLFLFRWCNYLYRETWTALEQLELVPLSFLEDSRHRHWEWESASREVLWSSSWSSCWQFSCELHLSHSLARGCFISILSHLMLRNDEHFTDEYVNRFIIILMYSLYIPNLCTCIMYQYKVRRYHLLYPIRPHPMLDTDSGAVILTFV